VKKALRAVDGAVLVVDDAVGMVAIGVGDELPGGRQVLVAPWAQLQFARQIHAGRIPETLQSLHHEEPAEDLETGLAKDCGVGA
jgi:hypothetical protein